MLIYGVGEAMEIKTDFDVKYFAAHRQKARVCTCLVTGKRYNGSLLAHNCNGLKLSGSYRYQRIRWILGSYRHRLTT